FRRLRVPVRRLTVVSDRAIWNLVFGVSVEFGFWNLELFEHAPLASLVFRRCALLGVLGGHLEARRRRAYGCAKPGTIHARPGPSHGCTGRLEETDGEREPSPRHRCRFRCRHTG